MAKIAGQVSKGMTFPTSGPSETKLFVDRLTIMVWITVATQIFKKGRSKVSFADLIFVITGSRKPAT